MTHAELRVGEPTALKSDSVDQTITSEDQTGISTSEAQEQYRIKGMAKVDYHDHTHDDDSSCSYGL